MDDFPLNKFLFNNFYKIGQAKKDIYQDQVDKYIFQQIHVYQIIRAI